MWFSMWVACGGDKGTVDATDVAETTAETGTPPTTTDEVEAWAGPSLLVPNVLAVTVAEAGRWHIEYGVDALDGSTPEVQGTELDVRGLPPDSVVRWRVVGTDASGEARSSAEQRYVVPASPVVLPDFTLEIDGDPGFEYLVATVLIDAPINRSALVVLDKRGQLVWWIVGDTRLSFVTPSLSYEDGEPVVGWVQTDDDMVEDVSRFVQVPLSGAWRRETRLPLGHHAVVLHEGGELAYLTHIPGEDIIFPEVVDVVSDAIEVGRVGQGENAVTTMLFDHFTDFPTRPRVGCIHSQPVLTKLGFEGVREITHANSMVYVPEDDAYIINDKFTDWLYEVDRSTGEVQWVVNGDGSDFTNPDGSSVWTSPDDTTLWSHAHTSEAWSTGAMMFDNGDHRVPAASRVMEVSWDLASHTVRPVWIHDHPTGGFTRTLGDAHRLPDDRVLITWSTIGTIEVVKRDHTSDWRLRVGAPGFAGRVMTLGSLYGTP
ncbi:MAG: aryl-sulfate sulfotransferase [Myxococcales bacterium]|nr:aryl-sulfate sulfotransferase [Myxococcales bacterium]